MIRDMQVRHDGGALCSPLLLVLDQIHEIEERSAGELQGLDGLSPDVFCLSVLDQATSFVTAQAHILRHNETVSSRVTRGATSGNT